jgi:signal transduction histidine kinase
MSAMNEPVVKAATNGHQLRPALWRRLRLPATVVAAVVAAQTLVLLFGREFAEHRGIEKADQHLQQWAGHLVSALAEHRPLTAERLAQVIAESDMVDAPPPHVYLQAHDPEGRVLARSANLDGMQFSFDEEAFNSRRNDQPLIHTLYDPQIRELTDDGESLRLLTLLVGPAGSQGFQLHIATPVPPAKPLPIGWFFVASTLAAAVSTGIGAGHASRRLTAVTQWLQAVQPHALNQRLGDETRDEVGDLVRQVNALLDRTEVAFLMYTNFVHRLGEELKNPIAAVRAEASINRLNGRNGPDLERLTKTINEEMIHLGHMIDGLVALSQADHSKASVSRTVQPLNETVVAAVDQCVAAAQRRDVKLALNLRVASGPTYCGQRDLMCLMLRSILRRAIDASPPGMTVDVRVDQRAGDSAVIIRHCEPSGAGDARSREARDRDLSRDMTWNIAQSIADLHGAHLECSHQGGHLVFSVSLPTM